MTRRTWHGRKKKKKPQKPKKEEGNKNSVELKNATPQNGLFHHVESERSRDLYISRVPPRERREKEERKKKPRDRFLHHGKRSLSPLKTRAFESDEWRERDH